MSKIPTKESPADYAREIAADLGMCFEELITDALHSGYVYSNSESFIIANDVYREFGDARYEKAYFVTLAVGSLTELLRLDPNPTDRKWLGFCRENEGRIHWLDYQRLRIRAGL
jgi:hypothetical protein